MEKRNKESAIDEIRNVLLLVIMVGLPLITMFMCISILRVSLVHVCDARAKIRLKHTINDAPKMPHILKSFTLVAPLDFNFVFIARIFDHHGGKSHERQQNQGFCTTLKVGLCI